jgi:ATP phosphoribosyltransferase regulatory subunit
MVYQTPTGARDLLPLDVIQKRWIEDRLQQVFYRWGYHRIITSTLERLDTLIAGGAIQRSTVVQLQDVENEGLGLRPELTASIARTAVTRMAGVPLPLRLFYNANVFRRSQEGNQSQQQEFYQAGVELLGSGGALADAEILLLLRDCLNNLGLERWHLILGEADLTRSLLTPFPASLQNKIRRALANLDRVALETLPLEPELRDRALFMLDLRGRPADVLQRVSQLALNATQRESVNNLKSLLDLLQSAYPNEFVDQGNPVTSYIPHPITLDLSLIHTLDYYTGVVFEVVSASETGHQVLGRGGRYDQLLGVYHPQGQTHPGIGFMLQIEQLHQVLLQAQQLPTQTPATDYLVVAESRQAQVAAFAYAQKLRESDQHLRVEIELNDRPATEIREYAQQRRIQKIVWIKVQGDPEIERLT